MPSRSFITRALVTALLGGGALAFVPVSDAAAADAACTAMTTPVRQLVNPTSTVNLLTPWADEASAAKSQYGFTTDLGQPFKAAG